VKVVKAAFMGLDPWSFGSEIIECEGTSLGNVDLHNDCDVTSVVLQLGAYEVQIKLTFQVAKDGVPFSLTFDSVSSLTIEQRSSEGGDGQVFHALDYYSRSHEDFPVFEVDLESASMRFSALRVRFEHLAHS
jgi:hypothetical protein